MKCKVCRHNNKGHNCFPAVVGKKCRGAYEELQAENESHLRNIELRAKHNNELQDEIAQLKGRKPIPGAWWKDCPNLAQVTMERIIERNDKLEDAIQLSVHGDRADLTNWLKIQHFVSDQPLEKEKVITLRQFVILQVLKNT